MSKKNISPGEQKVTVSINEIIDVYLEGYMDAKNGREATYITLIRNRYGVNITRRLVPVSKAQKTKKYR